MFITNTSLPTPSGVGWKDVFVDAFATTSHWILSGCMIVVVRTRFLAVPAVMACIITMRVTVAPVVPTLDRIWRHTAKRIRT